MQKTAIIAALSSTKKNSLKHMKNYKPIILYPKGIKGANKLPVEDLRQLAHFNKIVFNSIKMDRILEESKN